MLYLEVGIMVEICLSIKSSNAHRNNLFFYLFYPPWTNLNKIWSFIKVTQKKITEQRTNPILTWNPMYIVTQWRLCTYCDTVKIQTHSRFKTQDSKSLKHTCVLICFFSVGFNIFKKVCHEYGSYFTGRFSFCYEFLAWRVCMLSWYVILDILK